MTFTPKHNKICMAAPFTKFGIVKGWGFEQNSTSIRLGAGKIWMRNKAGSRRNPGTMLRHQCFIVITSSLSSLFGYFAFAFVSSSPALDLFLPWVGESSFWCLASCSFGVVACGYEGPPS